MLIYYGKNIKAGISEYELNPIWYSSNMFENGNRLLISVNYSNSFPYMNWKSEFICLFSIQQLIWKKKLMLTQMFLSHSRSFLRFWRCNLCLQTFYLSNYQKWHSPSWKLTSAISSYWDNVWKKIWRKNVFHLT